MKKTMFLITLALVFVFHMPLWAQKKSQARVAVVEKDSLLYLEGEPFKGSRDSFLLRYGKEGSLLYQPTNPSVMRLVALKEGRASKKKVARNKFRKKEIIGTWRRYQSLSDTVWILQYTQKRLMDDVVKK